MSPTRQASFEGWLRRWGLDESGPVLDAHEVFGRRADLVLDIGFGHGESALQMSRAEPAVDIIGVEIHTPGVAVVLEAIAAERLDNVRVVHGDALVFLDRIAADSLAGVRVFFPDPWPKLRHHHRRLIGSDVVVALTDRLHIGGSLHVATDIADYAATVLRACDAEPRLVGGTVDRPSNRPLTRFEQRGLAEGRVPVDLVYRRTG